MPSTYAAVRSGNQLNRKPVGAQHRLQPSAEMLTSLAAHLLVRLVEEDVVDARRVLEVHGAVA